MFRQDATDHEGFGSSLEQRLLVGQQNMEKHLKY